MGSIGPLLDQDSRGHCPSHSPSIPNPLGPTHPTSIRLRQSAPEKDSTHTMLTRRIMYAPPGAHVDVMYAIIVKLVHARRAFNF